jgi:hypothetical protein
LLFALQEAMTALRKAISALLAATWPAALMVTPATAAWRMPSAKMQAWSHAATPVFVKPLIVLSPHQQPLAARPQIATDNRRLGHHLARSRLLHKVAQVLWQKQLESLSREFKLRTCS